MACSLKLRLIISSTFNASTRNKFRIMLYVKRNWLESFVGVPRIMRFSVAVYLSEEVTEGLGTSGISSAEDTIMTVPVASRPRRPARPAICVISPGKRSRNDLPSCFLIPEKTTVLAGILTPFH